MDLSLSDVAIILIQYVLTIISNFMTFIFDDFVILPFSEGLGVDITFGYFIIGSFILSLLFRFLLAVPQTGGGGSRGKSKRSKKDSSSSNSSDTDS